MGSYKGEDARMEAEVKENRRCCASGLKDGGRGHEPGNAYGLKQLQKAREPIFP